MIVYRAAPLNANIRKNDHVTTTRKYAIEHAITSSVYHGENYAVYMIIVNEKDLNAARNPDDSIKPGQFHLVGNIDELEVYLAGIAKYDEDLANSEYARVKLEKIDNQTMGKLSGLKHWLYKNNHNDEYNLLKQSMPRPYGSLFDVESGRYPSEEFDSEKVTAEGARGMRAECEERVCWYGHADRMIRVDVDYIYPVIGNQFYPDLVKRIEDKIRNSSYSNPARLYCGYCNVKKINIIDIKESLEYYEYGQDEFLTPLTTGDKELDKYIKDKEEYLEDWESQYDQEEAENLLERAIANNEGDLGKYIYQIRNGNHRVFAAKNAGEKYIWTNLSISDYEGLKGDSVVYDDYTELKKHFGFI